MKASAVLPVSELWRKVSSCTISVICHGVAVLMLALIPLAAEQAQLHFIVVSETEDNRLLPPEPIEISQTLPQQVQEAAQAGETAIQSHAVRQSAALQLQPTLDSPSDVAEGPSQDNLADDQLQGNLLRPAPLNRKPTGGPSAPSPEERAHNLQNDPYILVVARFIQYDIGKLPGAAGQQARRDFYALGEDAILALVWGLNQSAYLTQSCPVIVIQSKLNEELSAAGKSEYVRYALDNVGRGVPPNAPYASRLMAYRRRLGGGGDLAAQQAAQQRQATRNALVRRLRRAPRKLRQRLSDSDANVRWAAARLTAARGQPLVDELAALLVDPDEDVRHEAHEALMRISRGEDYGPLDDTNLQERQEAKERWREWWVFAQRERKESINRHRVTDTPEEIAEIALKMAGNLERTGRQEEADRRYRNIASRFPDTDAPRVARERFAP